MLELILIELLLMLEEVVIVFFRAVSYQLYENPNNHYLLRSLGIEEKTYVITLIVICHSALSRNRYMCAI